MKLLMFVVQDSCSGVYDRPFCGRSRAEAIRSFGDIAQSADHPIGQHPEHFHLFEVGTFDDSTGEIEPIIPNHLVKAIDLVDPHLKGNGEQRRRYPQIGSGPNVEEITDAT